MIFPFQKQTLLALTPSTHTLLRLPFEATHTHTHTHSSHPKQVLSFTMSTDHISPDSNHRPPSSSTNPSSIPSSLPTSTAPATSTAQLPNHTHTSSIHASISQPTPATSALQNHVGAQATNPMRLPSSSATATMPVISRANITSSTPTNLPRPRNPTSATAAHWPQTIHLSHPHLPAIAPKPPSLSVPTAHSGPPPPSLPQPPPLALPTNAPSLALPAATPSRASPPSISLSIARLITEYLGPLYPRRDSVGATLNALRTRLETDTSNFDKNSEILVFQVREALRTEFFKIVYPTPPAPELLRLLTRSELLMNPPKPGARPFYFPGARVAVPTEAGSRRAGTTLQLRFRTGDHTKTEALLHLDGPGGGGFQWVQTQALSPLIQYIVPPKKPARAGRGRGRARKEKDGKVKKRSSTGKKKVASAPKTTPKALAKQSASPTTARTSSGTRPSTTSTPVSAAAASPKKPPATNKSPVTPKTTPSQPSPDSKRASNRREDEKEEIKKMLPPTFVPDSILDTQVGWWKKAREGVGVTSWGVGTSRVSLKSREGENVENVLGKLQRIIGVERLVARREVDGGGIEYFVKWSGRSIKDGSWERKESLMKDVPGCVMDFEVKHPWQPKRVCCSDRVKTEEETVIDSKAEKTEVKIAVKTEIEEVKEVVKDGEVQIQTKVQSAKSIKPKTYVDDLTGLHIPAYVDTPILELGFAGMVLQIRRPGEYTLHHDASAAMRDMKKRQSKLKQDDPQLGTRLFALTKPEARAVLDTSLRMHKVHGRYPILFPRGLGGACPVDTGTAFSAEVVQAAPPSWERYFMELGLRPKHFHRTLPPFFPTLNVKSSYRFNMNLRDLAHERVIEDRERARICVRSAHRYQNAADPPASLFRDGKKRPFECDECYSGSERQNAVTKIPRVISQSEQAARGKETKMSEALEIAKQGGGKRWYDHYWSCWRQSKPSTK